MICYIFGASEISDYTYYKDKIDENSYIICADGGIKHIEALGLTPDIIIGDFDSSENTEKYSNKIVYPAEKDDTDLGLALSYAYKKGFTKCVAIGCLGGRLDHTLANIHLLKYAYDKNIALELIDSNTKVILVKGNAELSNDGYKYISVFPLGDTARGISYEGLKYPLLNATLKAGLPIGVSNQFEGEKALIKSDDPVVVILIK